MIYVFDILKANAYCGQAATWMKDTENTNAADNAVTFLSSVSADVWHPREDRRAYEWWYFDALSSGGNEGVIIVFLDNFIYSPRYNARSESKRRFPAVSFTYFRDGKIICRSVVEYPEEQFRARQDAPQCTIGGCSFRFQSAPYGSGYTLHIAQEYAGGKRVAASLEWLSVEGDLRPSDAASSASGHSWNMVAPRSDVTGNIRFFDRRGRETDEVHFRGTGYHDHNLDNRWLARTVRDWHWGRAHFADSTAVFYRYCEIGDDTPNTKLLVIRSGELTERAVDYDEQNYARDRFGIRYATRLRMISEDNVRLRVKPIRVIESSFYYLRFLSEVTLTLRDGVPRKNIGITEFIAPQSLKYRWLNRISDIRTGKNGKSALL